MIHSEVVLHLAKDIFRRELGDFSPGIFMSFVMFWFHDFRQFLLLVWIEIMQRVFYFITLFAMVEWKQKGRDGEISVTGVYDWIKTD